MSKLLVDSCVFINAFKSDSEFQGTSRRFLEDLSIKGTMISMPAHGWFEVLCSLRRIEKVEKKFDGMFSALQHYPLELIHIDAHFIGKYGNVEIPYAKAGDHIYLVVAYVNGFPLVTWDKGMTNVARELNVAAYTPAEYLALPDACA